MIVVELESNTVQIIEKFGLPISILFIIGLIGVIITNFAYLKNNLKSAIFGLIILLLINIVTLGVIFGGLPILNHLVLILMQGFSRCSGEGCFLMAILTTSLILSTIGLFLGAYMGDLNKRRKKV